MLIDTLIRVQWSRENQEWWIQRGHLSEDGTAQLAESGFCPSLDVISEWLTDEIGLSGPLPSISLLIERIA